MPDLHVSNRRIATCALAFLVIVAVLLISATPTQRAAEITLTIPPHSNIAAANTNGKIAFTNDRDGNIEIYVMNPDGSGQMRLTNNTAFDGDPAWSPDGTRIVFTSTRDGNEEIYVMNANGTGQTRLTNNSASMFNLDRTPAWSPDGSQIVFASNRDTGDFDIFTMNTDGSAQTNLTSGVLADFQDPDWSPDGTKIACSQAILQNGVRGPYGVLVMNADGTNQTRLTSDGNVDITPRWSPDGAKFVFASSRAGNLGTFQVFVMNANGSGQSRLTNNTGENSRPGWAPDGTKIVFQSTQRFSFDVYTINAGGGNEQQLTNTLAQEAQPVWQPVSTEPFNPIDDPEVFVRRQYLDFLNREPDPAGFAYWVGQITQCGNDQNCINSKRVDVAAAFFIEQEFQQTGFFVYRIYQASLCRRPTFTEFLADRADLIAGTDLETNKAAFVQEFVARAEFIQRFPLVMTRDTFIETLITAVRSCSGPDLTNQRSILIGEYNSSTNQTVSRARVLRLVADNVDFVTAEFNRGFVLAEYFGFLRRDADQAGFDFWLDVIDNREQGEYLAMVCAFITSGEYQRRFGPVITHSNAECGP